MARENMEEWGTSFSVVLDTIRVAVKAFAKGEVKFDPVPEDTNKKYTTAPGKSEAAGAPGRGGCQPGSNCRGAETISGAQPLSRASERWAMRCGTPSQSNTNAAAVNCPLAGNIAAFQRNVSRKLARYWAIRGRSPKQSCAARSS